MVCALHVTCSVCVRRTHAHAYRFSAGDWTSASRTTVLTKFVAGEGDNGGKFDGNKVQVDLLRERMAHAFK